MLAFFGGPAKIITGANLFIHFLCFYICLWLGAGVSQGFFNLVGLSCARIFGRNDSNGSGW